MFEFVVFTLFSMKSLNISVLHATRDSTNNYILFILGVFMYFLQFFSISKVSNITGHQALRSDPHLFKDDIDIRFSRTLNSCKLPQIRYATPERLLQRLTDLRFLSIDFLNTFLLTYRVFTGEIECYNTISLFIH
jgi:hypothetical protein